MMLMFFILLLCVPDTNESECSDAAEMENIPYIRMCEDGNVTSHRVIVDTHDSAATGGTTCSCFADGVEIVNIYIAHFGNGLNPNTSDCGSEVSVIGVTGIDREYKCNAIPIAYVAVRPVTLTWNMTSDGDSKYCLNITGKVIKQNTTLTITCSKPEIITTSSFTTSETTTQTTKITETTPTTNKVTTTAMTNVSNTDHVTTGPTAPTSSVPVDTSTSLPAESFPLIIVVPAAAGGFVLIVIIIIIAVVCCRKRNKYSKGRHSYIDDTIDPYGTSNPVANNDNDEDSDGLKINILYDTSGRISINGDYSSVQLPESKAPEDEYAKVKKNVPKQNEEIEQDKIELSNLNETGNDMYAVVNKSKKNKNTENSSSTSQTAEGLVYVEVDKAALKKSDQNINTSDGGKEKEKDNTESDHVNYAQVVVT
ncbi:uncharacterized protein LOC132552165 [Ylistrum balloti]|uniref:uncharacterized protein LOC132552165 n=1 Tax=Ylistrum balloti TaxID=509963 RepID=UPI0029058CB3|nr:uncharacterized protein LOC132552165 [Ylistrum balloti]